LGAYDDERARERNYADAAVAFTPYRMEDAHEATKMILDALMGVTMVDGRSPIKDLFATSMSISKRCPVCTHISTQQDPPLEELLLRLAALSAGKQSVSLEECLGALSAVSQVPDVRCGLCQTKSTVPDWTEITSMGPLALIVLGRFNSQN
jgi:uncharacterized UBP type Zn finger protein